ncbi:MAG: class I SAM-dependent methyltransferase, partial [Candidatus Acidiferrales bacterium]
VRAAVDLVARKTLRFENALYEYRLGIVTRGLYNWNPDDWNRREHIYYQAAPYRRVFRILDALRLGASDTVVDLGCGKGRVTCCASLYPICEVVGVEDVPELCAIAEKNLMRLRGKCTQARILHGRAEEFEYTKGTVIYMFHPFGPNTLAAVLSQLDKGLRTNPRSVRIVYVNPVHEYVLKEAKWLELYDRWPAVRLLQSDIMHPVSFWRPRDSRDSTVARAPIPR